MLLDTLLDDVAPRPQLRQIHSASQDHRQPIDG